MGTFIFWFIAVAIVAALVFFSLRKKPKAPAEEVARPVATAPPPVPEPAPVTAPTDAELIALDPRWDLTRPTETHEILAMGTRIPVALDFVPGKTISLPLKTGHNIDPAHIAFFVWPNDRPIEAGALAMWISKSADPSGEGVLSRSKYVGSTILSINSSMLRPDTLYYLHLTCGKLPPKSIVLGINWVSLGEGPAEGAFL